MVRSRKSDDRLICLRTSGDYSTGLVSRTRGDLLSLDNGLNNTQGKQSKYDTRNQEADLFLYHPSHCLIKHEPDIHYDQVK